MKKLFHFFLALMPAFSFFACGGNSTHQNSTEQTGGTTNQDYSAYNGTYTNENNNEEFNGQVTLQHLGGNKISFQITNGTANGCTGMLQGEAMVDDKGAAVYSGENCEALTFHLMEGKVHVEEKACDAWHGAGCPFSGMYLKQ